MKRTLADDIQELDRSLRALGRAIAESLGIPRLAAWLSRRS